MPSQEQVRAWQDEHRRLSHSWEYAVARRARSRHHPIVERVLDLRALIMEHRQV